MRSIITGTGIGIPNNVVTNHDLAKVMDTSDEWIRTRSGVEERRYVDDGQGSSDLGRLAAEQALAAAGKTKDDIDAIVFATMTPDHFFPGNGPVLQAKMGFAETTPTFDIRQQCSGFLYGLDLADSLVRSGKYKRVLLIGADVHTPFMQWQNNWDLTIGKSTRETAAVIAQHGGQVIGFASILNRSGRPNPFEPDPYETLLALDFETFSEGACPLCASGVPLDAPGSRYSK